MVIENQNRNGFIHAHFKNLRKIFRYSKQFSMLIELTQFPKTYLSDSREILNLPCLIFTHGALPTLIHRLHRFQTDKILVAHKATNS